MKTIFTTTLRSTFWVLLFLSLIQPFGIDKLEEGRILFILGQTTISFVAIFISYTIAYMVVRRGRDDQNSLRLFLLETLLMFALSIPMLGAMLLTFNAWFNTGNMWSYWFYGDRFSLHGFGVMCVYVSCISFFIFLFSCFQYRNAKLRSELDEVKAINRMLEQRQERLEKEETAEVMPDAETVPENTITITGQGQDATLTLCPSKIIYVESMANYADICYIHDNEICHKTLRITLKQIRETLEGVEGIVQCHRAFLVNINFVVAMTSKNPGYELQLFGMDKQIPVSRSNTDALKAILTP